VAWVREQWFYLALLGLGLWWFFTGDTPVSLVRAFVGRGRQLTTSTKDGVNVAESLDEFCAQISGILGGTPDPDAVIMARVAASESGKGTTREKTAIMLVLQNDAAKHFGGDLYRCATAAVKGYSGMGAQADGGVSVRRYSTVGGGLLGYREIHEEELAIAQDIRSGAIQDWTGGAEKFIHYTGYARLADYLAAHPKVQGWVDSGLAPVSLGGVGVLVVFTRTPEAAVVG
jgi:hypothetical protein